ncbi:MAG: OmpA family protein, partial [Myxococcota bacterium]
VEAAENEVVRVDNVVLLLDSSGSMEPKSTWGSTQNLAGSFVAGMPEGEYRAAVVTFGGDENQVSELAAFDRDDVDTAVYENDLLGKSSDIATAIDAAAAQLAGREGNNAVVVFSDGVASMHGRDIGAATTIAAAQQLAATGNVCFYAIQLGNNPKGSLLMEELAALTPCGQHANASDLTTEDELHDFQRAMFIEEVTPKMFVDKDGDGVEDGSDQCLGTPKMAQVNEFGCWVLDSYTFDTSESEIVEAQFGHLDKVAKVLEMNPDLRVRIDGHTDSTGTAKFNQGLSERRASAVRTYLEGIGIDPSRLQTKGFGMTAPVASNDTPEGMAQNRRCQMTVWKVVR